MKKILAPVIALLIAAAFLAGCDKADMKIKKLNHGDGTWTIKSIHYEYYDTIGHAVVSDSTVTEPGEIVFFTTTTLDALFDYHLCVINMKEANGTTGVYPGGVYFDNVRVHFEHNATQPNLPAEFEGQLWSVDDSSRRHQVWTHYSLRADGSLVTKLTMTLKFDKR